MDDPRPEDGAVELDGPLSEESMADVAGGWFAQRDLPQIFRPGSPFDDQPGAGS